MFAASEADLIKDFSNAELSVDVTKTMIFHNPKNRPYAEDVIKMLCDEWQKLPLDARHIRLRPVDEWPLSSMAIDAAHALQREWKYNAFKFAVVVLPVCTALLMSTRRAK